MATKKTKSNKKVGQGNKINKQKEIEQKRRKKKKSALIKLWIVIVIIIIVAYIFISPTFKIQAIEVSGNKELSKEEIMDITELKVGDNIFLKFSKILEVKLKQKGAVEKVKIKKLYPNRIEIEIEERNKDFQIQTEQNNYIYISEQGYVIGCGNEKLQIPIIIGMDITESEVNNTKRLKDNDLEKMENILQIYKASKEAGIEQKITKIQIGNEYIISLDDGGIKINLGVANDLKNQMSYAKALLKNEYCNKGTILVNGNLNEGFEPYFSDSQN